MLPEPLTVRDIVFLGQGIDLLKEKVEDAIQRVEDSRAEYYHLLALYRREHVKEPIPEKSGPEARSREETLEILYRTAMGRIHILTETNLPLPWPDDEIVQRVDIIISEINYFSRKYIPSDNHDSLSFPITTNGEHIHLLNAAFGAPTQLTLLKWREALGPRQYSLRLVNIILLRGLFQRYFQWPVLGIEPETPAEIAMKVLLDLFHGSEKETHLWKAQTLHLLTKRYKLDHMSKNGFAPNREFKKEFDKVVTTEVQKVWKELQPYGDPPSDNIARLQVQLEGIVRQTAEMGILFNRIAQWRLVPMAPFSVKVGEPFSENLMTLMDVESEEIYSNNPDAPVTWVLNAPWRKATFTEAGELTIDESVHAIIKARVSLVNSAKLSFDPNHFNDTPADEGLSSWGGVIDD